MTMISRLLAPFDFVRNAINKGHDRSVKAKKNIAFSFLVKGLGIGISLVLVPLTINYINPSQYGIWLTLSSIVGWFGFFDIGFGHGLRNKFTEAVANKDYDQARTYVSTTYAALGLIIAVALVFFLCINPFLHWDAILNTSSKMAGELSLLALIVFVFFCLQFVFQLITVVLTANQEPAKASLFNLFGSIFSLIIIFILTKTTSGNLLYLGSVLSVTPVLVLAASSIWFYNHEYKRYAPSIKYVKRSYARSLMGLGGKFFVIQMGVIIMYNTDNIIITQLLGPAQVTVFNIAFKLFSVITMIYFIIATPLWSAYTDAYTRKDWSWIRNTLSRMKKIWYILIVLTIILLLSSPLIFKLWIGDKVKVPFMLSVVMSLYVIGYMYQSTYAFFLNGISKIKLQFYIIIVNGVINIPLSILSGKYFGLIGIAFLSTSLFLLTGTLYVIQTNKILNNTATKIWNE
jgi:O-antigen/teichoic acid export membrane protein